MNRVCPFRFCCLLFLMAIATGCSPNSRKTAPPKQMQEAAAPAYQVDPLTAGSISGMIRYIGKRPLPKKIDMSGDPRMGAGSGRAFLVFRRTMPCGLRNPIRSRTVFTHGADQPGVQP
jgi:hypothetical protein